MSLSSFSLSSFLSPKSLCDSVISCSSINSPVSWGGLEGIDSSSIFSLSLDIISSDSSVSLEIISSASLSLDIISSSVSLEIGSSLISLPPNSGLWGTPSGASFFSFLAKTSKTKETTG